jgi:preprotein translocase subunit YajC
MYQIILQAATNPAQTTGTPNPIMSFLPFILMIVIFYFLIIRPQQKKQKEHLKMLDSLQVLDKVIISGGIYGKVTSLKPDKGTVVIEIDETNKTKMEVQRSSVITILNSQATVQ